MFLSVKLYANEIVVLLAVNYCGALFVIIPGSNPSLDPNYAKTQYSLPSRVVSIAFALSKNLAIFSLLDNQLLVMAIQPLATKISYKITLLNEKLSFYDETTNSFIRITEQNDTVCLHQFELVSQV